MTTSTTSSKPLADIFVSVVFPCSNAADILRERILETHLLLKSHYHFYEIIVIDDNSADETQEVLAPLLESLDSLRVICLARVHGLEVAASAGIDTSIGDYIVVLSPATDPIANIPELVELTQKKKSVIYGLPDTPVTSWFSLRPLFSLFFSWYSKKFLNIDIQRGASLLRAMDRSMANTFTQNRNKQRSLRVMTAFIRYASFGYHYKQLEGATGRLRNSFWRDLDMAFDILTSISPNPMRMISRLSFVFAFLTLSYNIYVIAIYLFKKDVLPGWATLSLEITSLFFMMFVVLAIFSEYVGKLLNEVKGEESYSIAQEKNSSVLVDAAGKLNLYKKGQP